MQIVLNVGDILTTPWGNLSLEINPLIQRYGLALMCAGKVFNIVLFTVLWICWPHRIFRRLLGILVIVPMAMALVWNVGGIKW